MTTIDTYIADRFLAAFDAAQSELGASDADMATAIDTNSKRHLHSAIRRTIARHMARREDGRWVPTFDIARAINQTVGCVNTYLCNREDAA